jgi:hypothetical protein
MKEEKNILKDRLLKFRESIQERIKKHIKKPSKNVDTTSSSRGIPEAFTNIYKRKDHPFAPANNSAAQHILRDHNYSTECATATRKSKKNKLKSVNYMDLNSENSRGGHTTKEEYITNYTDKYTPNMNSTAYQKIKKSVANTQDINITDISSNNLEKGLKNSKKKPSDKAPKTSNHKKNSHMHNKTMDNNNPTY